MLRASLVSLGVAMLLLWVVGLVDDSTWWMTWIDGGIAILTLLLVPITREDSGPIGVAAGPFLLGGGLLAEFVVGLAIRASAWLTWFTFAFACGYFLLAGFAFFVRAVDPQLESRRPVQAL